MHNVWNCHNVANHCKFDARNSVRLLLLHGDDHYQYRVSGHAPTVPHSTIRRIHFQQNGAPPHYLEEVREYLNIRFPAAPIAWPPRSPDHTPLDFYFLWGFVKDRVFMPFLPANVAELRTRITAGRSCRSDARDAT
jgi:hypothetical protein